MNATRTQGVHYAWTAAAVMAVVAVVAWLVKDQWLVFSAAILGLYVLHLVSVRYIVQAHADQLAALSGGGEAPSVGAAKRGAELSAESGRRIGKAADAGNGASDAKGDSSPSGETMDASHPGLEGAASATPGAPLRDVAIPRHFMLGTVAIVRSVMEPEAVARVLMEQRQQPGKRFGELAVEMGLITDEQLEMLLEAQQRGLFTDAEIREARQRLETFRKTQTLVAPAV